MAHDIAQALLGHAIVVRPWEGVPARQVPATWGRSRRILYSPLALGWSIGRSDRTPDLGAWWAPWDSNPQPTD